MIGIKSLRCVIIENKLLIAITLCLKVKTDALVKNA